MEPVLFTQNSWHYRLASLNGLRNDIYKDTDICTYLKQIGTSILMLIAFVSLTGTYLTGFGSAIYFWFHGIFFPADVSWFTATVTFFYAITSLIVSGIVALFLHSLWNTYCEKRDDKLDELYEQGIAPKQSFIKHAYRSIKDKVCFNIKIS